MARRGRNPSRFFLNMGNQRRGKSYVSSILNSHDVEVYSLEGRLFGNLIIRYLMMYFSALRLFN